LGRAIRRRRAGPYQLQAAIVACHADAASAADTDWDQIRTLYERLLEVMPGPVVRLNHAVATAMSAGPAAVLALVEQLRTYGQLEGYYLLHAARADLLRRLGRTAEAGAAHRRALEHTGVAAERRYLTRPLAEVESPEASIRRTGFSSAG
jgi:RNA polymerase sigma-70 factor (ECF subfamily)